MDIHHIVPFNVLKINYTQNGSMIYLFSDDKQEVTSNVINPEMEVLLKGNGEYYINLSDKMLKHFSRCYDKIELPKYKVVVDLDINLSLMTLKISSKLNNHKHLQFKYKNKIFTYNGDKKGTEMFPEKDLVKITERIMEVFKNEGLYFGNEFQMNFSLQEILIINHYNG